MPFNRWSEYEQWQWRGYAYVRILVCSVGYRRLLYCLGNARAHDGVPAPKMSQNAHAAWLKDYGVHTLLFPSPPTASSSTSRLRLTSLSPTSTRTRKTSAFRHVPTRAAWTPIVPSSATHSAHTRSVNTRSVHIRLVDTQAQSVDVGRHSVRPPSRVTV
jgi:hypothetical protein